MESLRRLLSGKKDNPWKTLKDNLEELLQPFHYSALVDNKDLNPWKGWCRSWEMYERSHSKTPKSGKERAAVWRELYYLAKFSEGRLDEAVAMRQQLANQTAIFTNLQKENVILQTANCKLQTKCESLQREFDNEATAIRKRLETQTAELTNLQKENLALETKCKSLQEQLHFERCKNDMNDHLHKIELEEEVNQRQLAQIENKAIVKQCNELERQVYQINNYNQYHKNITIVNCPNCYFRGEESWHEQAMRAGVGCPSRYKILKRLENYEEPNYNATFWELVVRLSLHGYLGKTTSNISFYGISRNRSLDCY